MTREVIEAAKKGSVPFAIKMAAGREYPVPSADRIHVAKTHIVVIDDKTYPHILPLLTIAGLSYLPQT